MDKTITSKRLVRGVFESADLPRLPFIPWVFSHAARLEQIPIRRMYGDPTQYVKCLQNARKLYGYDAVISSFDSSLEMELCGCTTNWKGDYEAPSASSCPAFNFGSLKDINVEITGKAGRFGTVVESCRRINMVLGPHVAMAAVVTGPLTLTASLLGRDLIQDLLGKPEEVMKAIEATAGFLLKVVQVYCQMKPDIIAIADRLVGALPLAHIPWLNSIFSPVMNTVRFYDAFSILLPGESSADGLANLIDLGFDGIVTTGIDLTIWNRLKGGRPCILGKAIPSHFLRSERKELQGYLETQLQGGTELGVFLTTDWEVPPDTPPDNVHLIMNTISKA
jgi:uroporphyrinogen-III decarboxylase